jgi:putative phage-type endonuclease
MTATASVVIPITSEDQWLAERAKDVTSTEIAALYGLSPYVSHFELWHRKKGNFIEEGRTSERVTWGKRLQDAIAAGVAEDRGWEAARFDSYVRVPELRIGSSFDFRVTDQKLGPGLMEIKNVDKFVFREEWIDDGTGIEAPQHIELQVQHQMEVAGVPWCALVALVGGNEARVVIRERDERIGADLRKHAAEFWFTVNANTPPTPDYRVDAEFLGRLYGMSAAGVTIDADPETENLLARYVALGELIKERDAVKAQVLERIGVAERVRTKFGKLACGAQDASAGKLITFDMVGQRIGARAGFRMFRFTESKASKETHR